LECLELRLAPAGIPPTANPDSASTFANVPVQIDVLTNDTDPDDFTDPTSIAITQAPANGSFTLPGPFPGYVTYTPNQGFTGTDTFKYTVKDQGGLTSNEATVTVTVRPDLPPVAVDDTAIAFTNAPVTIHVLANDTEADDGIDPTSVQIVGNPANGTASLELDNMGHLTGNVVYKSNPGFEGADTFQYNVKDIVGGLLSNTATVSVTVRANLPPVAVDDSASAFSGAPATIHVLANDTEPDDGINPASVVIVSNGSNGSATPDPSGNGNVIYTSNAGFIGTDTFKYTVSDLGGLVSNTATVTVTVVANQPPVAVADAVTTVTNLPTTIDVLANDTEPDDGINSTTLAVVTNPTNGTAMPDGFGHISYTSNSGFVGTDTFTYDVADFGGLISNVATVTVTVGPKVTPTFINLGSPTIPVGTPYTNISGQLNSNVGGQSIPGETVMITLNGITQSATLDPADNFAAVFPTLTLAAGTYPISFSYPGDTSFFSATGSSMLTVGGSGIGTTAFTNLSSPTITFGTATTTISGHLGARPGLNASVFQTAGSPWPGIGMDTDPNPNLPSIIFTLSPDGTFTTTRTVNFANPFDGIEDTYIGVVNPAASGLALTSLDLTGPDFLAVGGLFNLDGDGIGTFNIPGPGWFGYSGAFPGGGTVPGGSTGYEGPGSFFDRRVPPSGTFVSGTVHFEDNSTGLGLLPGQQAFLSLEEPPTAVVNGNVSAQATGIIPPGEPVQVTLNGVTQTAFLDSNDDFSTTFATATLGVAGSPYTIGFSYAGDPNFNAATGSSLLTVQRATPTITSMGGRFPFNGQPHPATGTVTGVFGESLGTPTFTYINSGGMSSSNPPVAVGTYTVVAAFAGNANYLPATNNTATIVIFQVGQPTDMSLAVTDSGPVSEGGNIVYNVTITNNGPADATDAVITDVLPSGTSFVAANVGGGVVDVVSGTLTVTIATVTANTTVTGTITLQALAEGAIDNTFTLGTDNIDTNPNNDTAMVSTAVSDPSVIPSGGFVIQATEGSDSGLQTVATFTDPGNITGTTEVPADYSATIDWGDGTTSVGVITNNNNGTWTVSGNHTYVGDTIPGGSGESEGTATIIVTISHDATPMQTAQDTANVSDPPVVATGGIAFTVAEGSATVSGTVATFTDPGNPTGAAEDAADYSASINWGDGSTSTGTVTNIGSAWTVDGSHTYAGDTIPGGTGESEGSAGITVTISHDATTPQMVSDTAVITDPDVRVTGGFTFTGSEGSATVNGTVATFTDPGNPTGTAEDTADYSASIDWGDGTTSAGSIASNNGTWTVTGTHTFAGDNIQGASGESEGTATITVTISHDATMPQTVTDTATITDRNVVATGGLSFMLQEGSATFSGTVATFTDPGNPTGAAEDATDYSASINWGDGATSTGTITNNNDGTWTVTGSHTYAGDTLSAGTGESEGTATITVTISHDATTPQMVTDTATVTDAAIAATGGLSFTLQEGSATVSGTLATFTDPGNPTGAAEDAADYSASINWGDTTTSTGTITNNNNGTWTVSGSHTYAGDSFPGGGAEGGGAATITVTISHDATSPQTVTDTATIIDPNVVATSGISFMAAEGSATVSGTLATFTDPGNPTGAAEDAADYSASINWGDGTTSTGTITNNNGTYTVTGQHTYTGETIPGGMGGSEGTATITVTISHDATTPPSVTDSATITDPSVLATSGFSFSADEGLASSSLTVATFTDPAGTEEPGDYSATIAWGDNTSSAGQITLSGSVFSVTGSHAYAEEGGFTISVTIHQDAATDVTVSSLVAVSDPEVVPTGSFSFAAVEGNLSSAQTVATFTDPAGPEPAANYAAQIAWGDNSTSVGSISVDGSTHVFSVRGSHTYSDEGTHNIIVAIGNESAPAVVVSSTATIADAALTATGQQLSVAEGAMVSGSIASFTDANPNAPLSDFSAMIVWGDGMTSTGSISQSGRGFAVQGMHLYSHDGNFTASVTITDIGGKSASTNTTVVVTEPAINATVLAVNGFEFTPLSDPAPATDIRVATFTHAGGLEAPSDFTATIDWGDGSSSTGTVRLFGTTYTVRATHIYTEEATFPIQVTISEDTGGATATVRTAATTLEQLLPDGTRGTANQRWLGEVYRDLLGRAIDPVGLANATNALNMGVSRFQIVSAIESSLEYRMKFINHLYFTLLGRVADPIGMQVSLDILGGRSFLGGQPTIEQLKAMIISSDEYFAKHGSTNSNFLEGLFRDVIGRDIDNSALVALTAQLAQGASRDTVALEVLNSAQAAGLLVQRGYLTYLNRNPDAANFGGWVNLLQTGLRDEDLLAFIVASDEFFARTAG
jgi:hypothetical protein